MNEAGFRLKNFLYSERIEQKDLAERLNKTPQYINGVCAGRTSLGKKLANKLQELIGVSAGWLLTGEGSMYASQRDEPVIVSEPTVGKQRGCPYYNVDFAAGFSLMENDQTTNPDYFIDFRPYNDCDCWCNTYGNSMYPTIASGDIVAMKRINDTSYLINGEIYGIVTSNGLRTIKRVHDNGDTITLIPDNKEVAEQTIPKSIITHIYLIKGSLKQF